MEGERERERQMKSRPSYRTDVVSCDPETKSAASITFLLHIYMYNNI